MSKKSQPNTSRTTKDGEVLELTPDFFRTAERFGKEELLRFDHPTRGRPKSPTSKKLQSFKLSPDVIEGIRKSGAGYNARVEKVLRQALQDGAI